MTRAVDDRLFSDGEDGAIGDSGGKDLKPEIDLPEYASDPAPEPSKADEMDDADAVTAKRAADLAQRAQVASKSYGLDRGTPNLDLLDF